MHFETEMYHAAAKSFVCARLATMREHSVLPFLYLYAVPDTLLLTQIGCFTQERHKVSCPYV